jgi:tetratricopeptide (TPR) repeat protein
LKNFYYILFLGILLTPLGKTATAQAGNAAIREGNKLYHKGQFDKALPEYQKAIEQNSKNDIARYNLANTRYRTGNFADAEKAFDDVINNTTEKKYIEKSYYNKGVAYIKEKKLQESIDAWKSALKLDPTDEDARFNLQKALTEQKKNESKEQKQSQQQQKQQQQKQKQNNKLDKKKIEQYLKSLEQKEQEVQQKFQQSRARGVTQPEKDW